MNCHDVQQTLSLYLYGELDFAAEEGVETHLEDCAFCQRALAREKMWHSSAASSQRDVPLELLAACRNSLHNALSSETISSAASISGRAWNWKWSWPAALRITPHRWSYQLAAASFLVFLGFAGGRFADRSNLLSSQSGLVQSSLVGPTTRIRDIQPRGDGRVRILYDQVSQQELVGSLDDQNVRRWLVVGSQDSADPVIRVDSVEMLGRQDGSDVRQALLERIERDPNAAVRLKALEAVRRFSASEDTRRVLRSVLERDADPAVRLQVIDVLAPLNGPVQVGPELAVTLQNLARSEHDEFVRGRCLEVLRAVHAPVDVY